MEERRGAVGLPGGATEWLHGGASARRGELLRWRSGGARGALRRSDGTEERACGLPRWHGGATERLTVRGSPRSWPPRRGQPRQGRGTPREAPGSHQLNWLVTLSRATMAPLPLAIADICDANRTLLINGELRPLPPIFQIYGKKKVFSGTVVTVKVFEDNLLARDFIAEKGHGRVLVIDGGGSMRRAVVGGKLATRAQDNGWAGIVVYGCIRDVDEINCCDIGVRALNSHPVKPGKKGNGEKCVPVTIAGTRVCNGDWLFADSDGIIVSSTELSV